MLSKQSQKAGDGSTQLQIETVNIGITYTDAKQIALDVFKANFNELSTEALKIVNDRVIGITDEVLDRLSRDHGDDFSFTKSPDFQYALLDVQTEFAKTGDVDLKKILVKLLIDRSKSESRSSSQIILDEAIKKASKLTSYQLNALSICWLLNRTVANFVFSLQGLKGYLDLHIKVFENDLAINYRTDYLHLAYTGVAIEMSHGNTSIVKRLMSTYARVFYKSITEHDIISAGLDISLCGHFFTKDESNAGKFNFFVKDHVELASRIDIIFKDHELYGSFKSNLINLYHRSKMTESEVHDVIIELCPYMESIFKIWDEGRIAYMYPTTVGIALAHANYSTLNTTSFGDVSQWI
jgi:hypothetical protein